MTLKKHNIKALSTAVNFVATEKFFIAFTGRKVHILSKSLEIINSVTDLKSVYHGVVSKDQKKLLLVSNSNIFYVYDLETQSLLFEHKVAAPYNYNLEGQGVWCFDDKTILICACHRKTLRPCLMFFNIEEKAIVKKVDLEDYTHIILKKLDHLNCYAIIGHKFGDAENAYIAYFNDAILTDKAITEQKIDDFDDVVSDFEYNKFLKKYILYGQSYSIICDYHGKWQKNLDMSYISKNQSEFYEALTGEISLEHKEAFINKIIEISNNSDGFEVINKILVSQTNDNIYVATSERVLVYNALSNAIECDYSVPFGVQNIVELNNIIAISTWNGLLFLKNYDKQKT